MARRGESSAGVAGALTLAGTETGIVVTPDDLDADPFLLNCPNGVLDLRTGQLGPHDPAPAADEDDWRLLQPGCSRAGVQPGSLSGSSPTRTCATTSPACSATSLEGRVVSHILPIFHGDGGNGKGTLINHAVLPALGDYADAADADLLTARSFDAHPTGVADLCGLRLAVLHETDAGRRLAEGTVKRLTGGDRLKARRMREDFWSFDPSHTFVMLTNHKPIVTGTDEGIWRRLRLVPWDVVIPDGRTGRGTAATSSHWSWKPSWPGSWPGYLDWRANGLADPEAVEKATRRFRDESDVLGRFLRECCFLGPAFYVGSSELFSAWSKWCADQGEDAGTQTSFASELQAKGLDNYTSKGRRRWRGIGVATTKG